MRVLRAADYRRVAWKNGGGETAEIIVFPAGSTMEDFDWRLSMADVASDGPFSAFPDIDRTLTLLEGAGMRLEIDGQVAASLSPASPPFVFPGDVPVTAALAAGPIRDLNVMTRRGRFTHRVVPLDINGSREVVIEADTALIFCREGAVIAGDVSLGRFDTFETDARTLVFSGRARLCLILLQGKDA